MNFPYLAQICEQIVSIALRALNTTNMIGPVKVKKENVSLLVVICRSKTPGSEKAFGKKKIVSHDRLCDSIVNKASRAKYYLRS